MKNIHLLPTDKPSRLQLQMNGNFHIENGQIIALRSYENIYITSDEEIKVGDWYLSIDNFVRKADVIWDNVYGKCPNKKIILTTDQDLIKDGVQAIDDDFLNWFVKNPSCEEVEVQCRYNFYAGQNLTHYKIIIPKEEHKQETLEEAASRVLYNKYPYHPPQDSGYWEDMFKEGYKFAQQQMYSEKEVPNKLDSVLAKITHQNDLGLSQWYEVVYYADGKWCSYSGSKTFEDGERVVGWKYCKEVFEQFKKK